MAAVNPEPDAVRHEAAPEIPPSPSMAAFEDRLHRAQEQIASELEARDGTARFTLTPWTRDEGGGGRMGLLVDGPVLEKAACHVSRVWGRDNPLTGSPFRAAGLSLIVHPRSPRVPAVHMNVRRFEEPEGKAWWGACLDLNPMGVRSDEDIRHFHAVLKKRLGDAYAAGFEEAERYFHLPHRGQARGAGGVFYDHLDSGDAAADRAFVEGVLDTFFPAYLPILDRRKDEAWTEEEREAQLSDRGRYAEFNLLYDRGTRFGLQSGGNVEAILSSLPPLARW